jgi:hypothetical protein
MKKNPRKNYQAGDYKVDQDYKYPTYLKKEAGFLSRL